MPIIKLRWSELWPTFDQLEEHLIDYDAEPLDLDVERALKPFGLDIHNRAHLNAILYWLQGMATTFEQVLEKAKEVDLPASEQHLAGVFYPSWIGFGRAYLPFVPHDVISRLTIEEEIELNPISLAEFEWDTVREAVKVAGRSPWRGQDEKRWIEETAASTRVLYSSVELNLLVWAGITTSYSVLGGIMISPYWDQLSNEEVTLLLMTTNSQVNVLAKHLDPELRQLLGWDDED